MHCDEAILLFLIAGVPMLAVAAPHLVELLEIYLERPLHAYSKLHKGEAVHMHAKWEAFKTIFIAIGISIIALYVIQRFVFCRKPLPPRPPPEPEQIVADTET
jgi:hypothetical protein